jgi:predicted hydrocarbon binding protein
MEAITHELPVRGNFFAEPGYLAHDLRKGTITNRSGLRILALTEDFWLALCNTLEAKLGDRAAPLLASMGKEWGRQAAQTLTVQMEQHFGKPMMELSLGMFSANLSQALQLHGWGELRFDFSRYPSGLVTVEVKAPFLGSSIQQASRPVETMLAGFLAGMFSIFAGTNLDCLQTECAGCGADRSRFILTIPERLKAVNGWVESGKSHREIIHELEQTHVERAKA